MSVPVCFFFGGEDLLFRVAALGVDLPGVEFGALIRDLRFQAGISMGFTTWIFRLFDERTWPGMAPGQTR